ncbi:hypothetical protein DUI87_20029 [Hirundo rustica rustica]|uniref:Uncharacterized protein n=1 Tax=Hirundo rustica rustica TaxID=333673 RepID=A0A3M0JP86_HIRRU|nr:hypothetical protein DUI87_20029 [Hirundo rustica rustica]
MPLKMHMPLAKPGPTGDDGNTSVIPYLRRKSSQSRHSSFPSQRREGSETMQGKPHGDTKASGEVGRGGSPGARAKVPLQAVVKTTVKHGSLELHRGWGSTGDAENHSQPMGELLMVEGVDAWRRL